MRQAGFGLDFPEPAFSNPGLCGSLRCRARGYVSRGWVGLPPDFHWAENSEKPQDSEFSQQRLRELLESSLRSPEDNLPEAPPIPGIRYVLNGSLDTGKLGTWETGSNSHFIR